MSELLGQSGRALPAVQPPVCTILGRSRPPAQAMLMFDQPGRAGRSRVPMKDAKGIEKFADEYLVGIIGFIYSAFATIFSPFGSLVRFGKPRRDEGCDPYPALLRGVAPLHLPGFLLAEMGRRPNPVHRRDRAFGP